MKVYLDIDGVILSDDLQPAKHAHKFTKFMLENYDVYWLTTHCKGDNKSTLDYLSRFFDTETLKLFKKIKPTNWNTLKTEAIDFSVPFLWFDDYLFGAEKEILRKHNVQKNWKKVNLSENIDQLEGIIISLENK